MFSTQRPTFSQTGTIVRSVAEMSGEELICLGLPFTWLVVLGNEWVCVCQRVQYV